MLEHVLVVSYSMSMWKTTVTGLVRSRSTPRDLIVLVFFYYRNPQIGLCVGIPSVHFIPLTERIEECSKNGAIYHIYRQFKAQIQLDSKTERMSISLTNSIVLCT